MKWLYLKKYKLQYNLRMVGRILMIKNIQGYRPKLKWFLNWSNIINQLNMGNRIQSIQHNIQDYIKWLNIKKHMLKHKEFNIMYRQDFHWRDNQKYIQLNKRYIRKHQYMKQLQVHKDYKYKNQLRNFQCYRKYIIQIDKFDKN